MQIDVRNVIWILEAQVKEDECIHIYADEIPTDKKLEMIKRSLRKQYGNVPMRILSPEEVIEVRLQLVPAERRSLDRLPLSHNKSERVVN